MNRSEAYVEYKKLCELVGKPFKFSYRTTVQVMPLEKLVKYLERLELYQAAAAKCASKRKLFTIAWVSPRSRDAGHDFAAEFTLENMREIRAEAFHVRGVIKERMVTIELVMGNDHAKGVLQDILKKK